MHFRYSDRLRNENNSETVDVGRETFLFTKEAITVYALGLYRYYYCYYFRSLDDQETTITENHEQH